MLITQASKKMKFSVLYLAYGSCLALASASSPLLIIDTDFGGGGCADVDDVAALCSMHALADSGQVELLAIIQDTSPPAVTGAISVVNTYYGRGDLDVLPIGAYKGSDLDANGFYLR